LLNVSSVFRRDFVFFDESHVFGSPRLKRCFPFEGSAIDEDTE
jgi:hypothetical protein